VSPTKLPEPTETTIKWNTSTLKSETEKKPCEDSKQKKHRYFQVVRFSTTTLGHMKGSKEKLLVKLAESRLKERTNG
jgi:hypothetical protein